MSRKPIAGIVVYCSDPRPENANLWKHIKAHLIQPEQRFAPIGQLGAPVALARPTDFPVKFAAIMEDIEFALAEFAEARIIIVGHDCGIYKRITRRQFTPEDKKKDLIKAAEFLRNRFPGMPVAAYYKKNGTGFEQIA